MKKPQKMTYDFDPARFGWNQCIDEMEKFLPSVEELKEIIYETNIEITGSVYCSYGFCEWVEEVAQAVHRRLEGK